MTAGETAVAAALSMVGRPYVYGARAGDTTCFDCSSLVQWALARAGEDVPRASIDQAQGLAPSRIGELQAGDLVFYDNALVTGPRCRGVNHVVMAVGDGTVVEASSVGGGVRVIPLVARSRPLAVRRPGVEVELPAWQYELARAIGLSGPWVLERGGRVRRADGAPGLGGVDRRAAAVVATPSGDGYWVAECDGRVVAFGDAASWGGSPTPVAAMAAPPSGLGYWLVDEAGCVTACGAVAHHGDGGRAGHPVTGVAATPSGRGYWLVDAGGAVSAHGDARHAGDLVGAVTPVVGIAATASGAGYWLADAAGRVAAFGDAEPCAACVGEEPVVAVDARPGGVRLLDAGRRSFLAEAVT